MENFYLGIKCSPTQSYLLFFFSRVLWGEFEKERAKKLDEITKIIKEEDRLAKLKKDKEKKEKELKRKKEEESRVKKENV